MCTYLACLTGLLAALLLAEPVSCEEVEKPGAAPPYLCPFGCSPPEQKQIAKEGRARLQGKGKVSGREIDVPSFILLPKPLSREKSRSSPRPHFVESFLVNWLFI